MPLPTARLPHRRYTSSKPISLQLIAPGRLQFDFFDIGFGHLCYQFLKTDGMPPAEAFDGSLTR
jgi:hypothetical protein